MLTPEQVEELDTKSKIVAYGLMKEMRDAFGGYHPQVQQRAFQVVLQRVQRVVQGEFDIIDDPSLTNIIEEAAAQEGEENVN